MEKLELKHLAPYLPYKLTCSSGITIVPSNTTGSLPKFIPKVDVVSGIIRDDQAWWVTLNENTPSENSILISEVKPILRPLSDLKEKEWFSIFKYLDLTEGLECVDIDDNRVNITWSNGETYEYYHSDDIAVYFEDFSMHGFENLEICTFTFREELLKRHVDIFGLIEKGLAIDINMLS